MQNENVKLRISLETNLPKELKLKQGKIEGRILEWLKTKKERGKFYLEIIFISPKKIHQLNKKYRGVDKPTTVLSFPQAKIPPKEVKVLGTIVLCLKEIKKKMGKNLELESEVLKLIKHGLGSLRGESKRL